MRILRGKWRGRTVPFPEGAPTRPLTEKAREALFNILSHHWKIEGTKVLDLFAGSGAVGLEFLSRGSAHATFVENNPKAAVALKALLTAWNAPASVYQMDALNFLEGTSQPMDFIFAGPPFRYWQKKKLIELIQNRGWLRKGGCFILEHPIYESYSHYKGYWRTESYVASSLSFFLTE
ncbi:MAG: 16S rRNA (guanine(966)-N(2))-methyltransferase RsmD [Bacteroidia bacterium]|nr:16S rRNA (guanine(966)-N(2))-methyltransferase RsmD [Bacteroidia bacterium]